MNTQRGQSAGRPHNNGSRRGRAGMGILLTCVMASSGLAGMLTAGPAAAAVPAFPDNIVVFPDRDFIMVENFQTHVGQTGTVEVTRPGVGVVGSAQGVVAAGDVAFEINHPGGVCWGNGTGLDVTPDIQGGDVVSISFAGTKVADTIVQDAAVTADSVLSTTLLADDTLTITGHVGPDVNTDQMEQRVVNPDLTELIGRRDIRAVPGPMTLAPKGGYESSLLFSGSTFTATYVFDSSVVAQIAASGGGERAMAWQFEDPDANRQGLTIAEYGELGGPGFGGCPNGPAQSGPPGPSSVLATRTSDSMAVTWTPAVATPGTPAITGYRATAVAQTPVATNEQVEIGRRIAGQGATGTTITGLASGETYVIEVVAVSSVGQTFPAIIAIQKSDIVAPTVSASPAGGNFAVPQEVTLTSNEPDAQIFFTTDGTDPVLGDATFYTAPIPVSGTTTLKFVAFDPADNRSPIGEATFNPTPAAPTFQGVPVLGLGQITLSWTAGDGSVNPITGYGVQVYGADGLVLGALQETTDPTLVVSGLTEGTPYLFTVKAQNVNGYGAESARLGPLSPLGALVANAGPDQSVARQTIPVTVTLDGAGSTPGASYSWSQLATGTVNPIPAGDPNEVTLNGATTPNPSFILPLYEYPMTNEPLAFRLTVTEGTHARTDAVLVTPRPDQVSVITARWKSGDFRITGAGSVVGATITVHQDSLGGAVLGRATVTAAVLGGDFSLRLRNGAAPAISPGTIWIESTVGGTSGPFTVTR